jgi:hypothetical protein
LLKWLILPKLAFATIDIVLIQTLSWIRSDYRLLFCC